MSIEPIESQSIDFSQVSALAYEQAAGGNCSLNVLRLAHEVNTRIQNAAIPAQVYSKDQEPIGNPLQIHENICRITTDTCLGATVEKTALGQMKQDLYLVRETVDGTRQAMRLWTIIEEPANRTETGECSRAIFWPAIEHDDWDYSTVATTDDENNSPSSNLLVEQPGLTNAIILKDVIESVTKGRFSDGLIDQLKIKNLIDTYLPVDINSLNFLGNTENCNEISRMAISRLVLLRSAGIKDKDADSFKSSLPVEGSTSVLHFVPQPEQNDFRIDQKLNDLGSAERYATIGRLCVIDVSEPPVIINEQGAIIKNVPVSIDSLFNTPNVVHARPELLTDLENILQEYRNIVPSQRNATNLNALMSACIRNYRDRLGMRGNIYIDLGNLDIRSLEAGSFFSGDFAKYLKIHVAANKDQEVFSDAASLYGCSVEGAGKAFANISDGRRLTAIQCKAAFIVQEDLYYRNTRLTDCTAKNATRAFNTFTTVSGCIAENCDEAFFDCQIIENSIAKKCGIAFSDRRNGRDITWTGNTAESCSNAFVYYNMGKFKSWFKEKNDRRDVILKDNTILSPTNYLGRYFKAVRKHSGNRQLLRTSPWRSNGNKIVNPFIGPLKSLKS